MKLASKVAALERASTAPAKLCSVTYKAGQGPEGAIHLPMEKALQEAKTGHVKQIRFPLTINEEQAERLYSMNQLDQWFEGYKEGIRRDTEQPSAQSLILCSKPIVFARQAPPHGRIGGYFITEDGTTFHQTEWRDILTKYHAGFIIVQNYDESQEPWHKERS